MPFQYRGQVVLVTGASSGIGRELALHLGVAGARVAVLARRRPPLDDLVASITAGGGTALAVTADVSCRDQVFEAVAQIRNRLGPVDVLFANAGIGMPTRLDPVNLDEVEAMIRINLLGAIYCTAAVLPEMLARKTGRIAVVSSLAGYVGLPGESAYCASKAAVTTYFDGLRRHLRGRGVTVTTLCPGFVQTPMTAENKFYMPGLMDAATAARRMLDSVARGRAVVDFPWSTTWLVRLARRLPDWLLTRAMSDYNAE